MRRGERVPVAMMSLYGFLALTSYYVVKSARNSVFVERVGAENLPYVYILTAVVVTVLMVYYSRYVDRVGERTLLLGTFGFLASNLVLFAWLLQQGTSVWSSGGFYIWAKLYPLLLVSQYWLVGNLLFTTTQAKRLFPVAGLGLIAGGIAGSALADQLAGVLGTETLLLVAAVALGPCAIIVLFLAPRFARDKGASARLLEDLSGDAIQILRRSSHLRTIAAILGLTIVVGTLLDWQLNRAVELTIDGEDAMTAFWGRFYMILNIVSLAIQGLLTAFVLRRFGVGLALLALPVALFVASVGVLAIPVLAAVALAKGTEGALRYSLDQSTRELLYLPVPIDAKYKVKPLIDLAVYRGGTGLGGVLLLVALNLLGWGIRGVAVLALVFTGLWIGVALTMRREWMQTLARSFERRFAHADAILATLTNPASRALVREALAADDPLRPAFALDLLSQSSPAEIRELAEHVEPLLEHPEPGIREKAAEVLSRVPDAVAEDRFRVHLADPEPSVRRLSARALVARGERNGAQLVAELLSSERPAERTAVLMLLAEENGVPEEKEALSLARAHLEKRLDAAGRGDREARLEVALAAATLEPREAAAHLEPLIEDPDPEVARAAVRSAGRVGCEELWPRLLDALGRPETRSAARESLAGLRDEVIPFLEERLCDPHGPPRLRRQIPSVLSRIACPATVDALVRAYVAPETDQLLDYRTLKAMNKLRAGHPELEFDPEAIGGVIERELRQAAVYERAIGVLSRVDRPRPSLSLLIRALREAWEERQESVFRCLGLLHDPDGMYRCHVAISGSESRARANALEWLEETVGRERFQRLAPVLGSPGREPEVRSGAAERDVLRELWEDNDWWIARCALWAAQERGAAWLVEELEGYRPAGPELRELARSLGSAVEQRSGDGDPSPGLRSEDGSLGQLQKVLLLRNVDLLQSSRTHDLALVASIGREEEVPSGTVLVRQGQATEALYVVLEGSVELRGVGEATMVAGEGTPFGTWALIDDEPSLVTGEALERTRLLAIRREEFEDLLADHGELAADLLRGLAERVRTLLASAS